MTEIREYRGKRLDNGEFEYGVSIKGNTGKMYIISYLDDSGGKPTRILWIEVDPETVGQYTGRNERPFGIKSDKKIYNGDKVCCYGGESCQGYWEYQTEFIVDDMDSDKMGMLDAYDYVDIIGNIHDNPELKGGE